MSPILRKRVKRTEHDMSQKTEQRTSRKPSRKTPQNTSPHSSNPLYTRNPNPSHIPQPPGLTFQLLPAKFGLIQERICSSLYALIVQAILWNQTRGIAARPVLFSLLATYPTPLHLSSAKLDELTTMLQPLGLHNIRAKRLIDMATTWCAAPPCKHRRYRKLHYPEKGCGTDVAPAEVLDMEDHREGWEIAHLPGVGRYAIDSFRIFYRDELRGMTKGEDGEWKRVRAEDKDLKVYLNWKWEMDSQGLNRSEIGA